MVGLFAENFNVIYKKKIESAKFDSLICIENDAIFIIYD